MTSCHTLPAPEVRARVLLLWQWPWGPTKDSRGASLSPGPALSSRPMLTSHTLAWELLWTPCPCAKCQAQVWGLPGHSTGYFSFPVHKMGEHSSCCEDETRWFLSLPTEHFFWARSCAGLWGGQLNAGSAVTVRHSHPMPWTLMQVEVQCQDSTGREEPTQSGGMRRGQRISQKEIALELGLEGQVGFCQLGKYGEWHLGLGKSICKGAEVGRSLKEVLSVLKEDRPSGPAWLRSLQNI